MCQKATFGSQLIAALFDHIVGTAIAHGIQPNTVTNRSPGLLGALLGHDRCNVDLQ